MKSIYTAAAFSIFLGCASTPTEILGKYCIHMPGKSDCIELLPNGKFLQTVIVADRIESNAGAYELRIDGAETRIILRNRIPVFSPTPSETNKTALRYIENAFIDGNTIVIFPDNSDFNYTKAPL